MWRMTHRGTRFSHVTSVALLGSLAVVACGGDSQASEGGGDAVEGESRSSLTPRTPPAPVIPAGTTLRFEVMDDVSTATHRPGDSFRLRLVDGVTGSGGASLPSGIEARGVVTQAYPSSRPEEEAVLGLRIETIRTNGTDRKLAATVESASIQSSTGDSGQRTAAKIATGAAAGAIVGQILGRDTRSTVGGAAVGAIAGTGIALSTRDGHAVLPRGSQVTVRLTEPLTAP